MRRYYILILIVLNLSLKSQDPSFSQFYNTPSYFMPSMSSENPPGISTSLIYRNQWTKLPGNFSTEFFSLNYSPCNPCKGFKGLGFTAFNDQEGLNWLNTTSLCINPIGGVCIGRFSINASISFQMVQRSINCNNLVFSDQLDEVLGIVAPSSFILPQENEPRLFFDPGWSISAKYQDNINNPNNRKWILLAGYAMHHATEPDQSFTGYYSKLPMKHVFLANAIGTRKDFNIRPGLIHEIQGEFKTWMLGSNIDCKGFATGIWLRKYMYKKQINSDAIVLYTSYLWKQEGLEGNKLKISYSYDLTVSMQRLTTGGSHEVIITYYLTKKCKKPMIPPCPDCPPGSDKYRPKLHYDHRGWH